MKAGKVFDLRLVGTDALNSLSMERAYKVWGPELTTKIALVEADVLD